MGLVFVQKLEAAERICRSIWDKLIKQQMFEKRVSVKELARHFMHSELRFCA
jgi:hypothetical protein